MTLEPNTNSEDCYRHEFTDKGDCCCNCINLHKAIHPVLGFVGYVCKFENLEFSELSQFIGHSGHAMCELHQRVVTKKYKYLI